MQTTFSLERSVWLSNPANIIQLDPEAPEHVFIITTLWPAEFDSQFLDYVQIGTAIINYSIDFDSPEVKAAAIEAVKKKIQEETDSYAERMMVLKAAMNSLLAIGYSL
jgi:hypothetical protein